MRTTWDETFMLMALATSMRSKDPRTKVGAIGVDADRYVIGGGYNGFVTGIDESAWTSQDPREKDSHVIHAEENLLIRCANKLVGSTVYITLYPCERCFRMLAQAGCARVVYLNWEYTSSWVARAVELNTELAAKKGVRLEALEHSFNPDSFRSCVEEFLRANRDNCLQAGPDGTASTDVSSVAVRNH